MHEFQLAVLDYSAAITADPRNSFAYYNRGITRDRCGEGEGGGEWVGRWLWHSRTEGGCETVKGGGRLA